MSKIDILIQEPSPRYGDKGQPLFPGFTYTVNDTPKIQDLISDGFATDVTVPKAEDSTQKTKKQDSASLTSEETSNG